MKKITFQKSVLACEQFLRIKAATQSIENNNSDSFAEKALLEVKTPFEQTYKSFTSSVTPSSSNKLITGNLCSCMR